MSSSPMGCVFAQRWACGRAWACWSWACDSRPSLPQMDSALATTVTKHLFDVKHQTLTTCTMKLYTNNGAAAHATCNPPAKKSLCSQCRCSSSSLEGSVLLACRLAYSPSSTPSERSVSCSGDDAWPYRSSCTRSCDGCRRQHKRHWAHM